MLLEEEFLTYLESPLVKVKELLSKGAHMNAFSVSICTSPL